MIVYKCTNKVNGKSYIGCTIFDLHHRINRHVLLAKRGGGYAFHNAIRKYGIESFDIGILHECQTSEEMLSLEVESIAKFNTFECGYNLTKGGDIPTLNKPTSSETKSKISKTLKSINLGGSNHYRTGTKRNSAERLSMSKGRTGKYTGEANHKSRRIKVYFDSSDSKEYISVKQASDELGINNNTMRTLTTTGKYSDKHKIRIEKMK